MFDIGGGELILIVLAIIVLFGPKKIPEIARMFGKGMQEFRRAQAQFNSQFADIKQEITNTVEGKPLQSKPIIFPSNRDQQFIDENKQAPIVSNEVQNDLGNSNKIEKAQNLNENLPAEQIILPKDNNNPKI